MDSLSVFIHRLRLILGISLVQVIVACNEATKWSFTVSIVRIWWVVNNHFVDVNVLAKPRVVWKVILCLIKYMEGYF